MCVSLGGLLENNFRRGPVARALERKKMGT